MKPGQHSIVSVGEGSTIGATLRALEKFCDKHAPLPVISKERVRVLLAGCYPTRPKPKKIVKEGKGLRNAEIVAKALVKFGSVKAAAEALCKSPKQVQNSLYGHGFKVTELLGRAA